MKERLTKLDPLASKAVRIGGIALLAAAISLALFGLLRAAWMCDDAYITLRTVDNWVHGYGLRWNVDERVQTYTHPLWMFYVTIPYFFTREPYYTVIVWSILTAGAGLFVLGALVARSRLSGVLAVLVACASHAFIDYSTSGLENPLSDLLLCVYIYVLLRKRRHPQQLTWLCFVGALLMLNRSDYLLLVGPSMAWEVLSRRSRAAIRQAIIGALPLVAWELFSLFYYGSLVPNTANAKLNHAIPHEVVMEQGWRWFWYTASLDWVTVLVILCAVVGAAWKRHKSGIAVAAGLLLYVFYVVWIGGDFMGGRFWLSPFMLALAYVAQCPLRPAPIALAASLATTMFLPLRTASYGGNPRDALAYRQGVWDERHSYFDQLGLVNVGWDARGPLHQWAIWGREEGLRLRSSVRSAVGMHGYYAGPTVHIVDDLALADPLLARLKPMNHTTMTVGHFRRHLPAGYFDSVLGNNVIVDPSLHKYYDHLQFITRGPLFSPRRLGEVLMFNLGRYKHYLRAYEVTVDRPQWHVNRLQINVDPKDGPECTRCLVFYNGFDLWLDHPLERMVNCAIVADRDRGFHVQWMLDDLTVGVTDFGPVDGAHTLNKYLVPVPRVAVARGFNHVEFTPKSGEPPFSYGGMECASSAEPD